MFGRPKVDNRWKITNRARDAVARAAAIWRRAIVEDLAAEWRGALTLTWEGSSSN